MPQLMPDPWFFIFSVSWFSLFISLLKILRYQLPFDPLPNLRQTLSHAWNWMW